MKRTLSTHEKHGKSQGRSTTRILHAATLSLVAITLLIPTASAGIIGDLVGTVDRTLDNTIDGIQEQTVPRIHVETEDGGADGQAAEAAEADEGAATTAAMGASLHTIETIAWWPFAVSMGVLVLAVAISLMRRRADAPLPPEAELDEAEVVWSTTGKGGRQAAPRSDAMATLENDLAGPAPKAAQ